MTNNKSSSKFKNQNVLILCNLLFEFDLLFELCHWNLYLVYPEKRSKINYNMTIYDSHCRIGQFRKEVRE